MESPYRMLIEQSPISIIVYSPDGHPIMANPASLALWNIPPRGWETLKENYNILNDPELENHGVMPLVKRAFNGEGTVIPPIPYDLNQTIGGQDEKLAMDKLWIKGYIYPVKDENGEIREVVLLQEDITPQKIAEEHLLKSEERFRELAENIREVFWLFDWQEQRVLYVSPAYEKVWGRSIEDLYERYEEWAESIHPGDLEYAQESFQQIVQFGGGEEREYRIVRPDGTVRWVSDRGFTIRDGKGQVVRIAGIAEDITKRKKVWDELGRRLAFEETIADISSRLVSPTNLDEAINKSLERMGSLSGASRAYMFLFYADTPSMANTHEWCAEGVVPEIDNLQNLSFADFPWVMPKLWAGEVVVIDDVRRLPPEASSLQESLRGQDIKSCLLMPVWVADAVAGFIGFDNTRSPKPWRDDDLALLRLSSEIIGNALTRKKFEIAERAARERTEVLRQTMLALTSNLDLDQVLNQLLIYLEKVIPYDSAAVVLLDEDRLRVKTGRGIPHFEEILGQTFSANNAIFLEMCYTGKPVILVDAQNDARFERWGDLDYVRGWMGIPLRGREGIIGYMTVDSRQVAAYGEEESKLGQTFASQASIAIENARLFQEVQNLAITDSLTGLYNRRQFFELATRELNHARRYARSLSAIMLDIDQFKRVNDVHGHPVGDNVLVQIGQRLKKEIRETDIIGRYGGEEFVILLPETKLSVGFEIAERIRSGIAEQGFETGNGPVNITVSLGVATLDENWNTIDDLLFHADQALYRAKEEGRNRVQI